MSRKNYRAVAAILAEQYADCHLDCERAVVRAFAKAMARTFSDDNPRFSVQRFYAACACGLADE